MGIIFAGLDKNIEVFGVSGFGIKCHSKSPDDAIFDVMFV
jgi:hypothetical protein